MSPLSQKSRIGNLPPFLCLRVKLLDFDEVLSDPAMGLNLLCNLSPLIACCCNPSGLIVSNKQGVWMAFRDKVGTAVTRGVIHHNCFAFSLELSKN
jgi:hypothetical protein